jgi:hypothetical protein
MQLKEQLLLLLHQQQQLPIQKKKKMIIIIEEVQEEEEEQLVKAVKITLMSSEDVVNDKLKLFRNLVTFSPVLPLTAPHSSSALFA